MKAISSPFSRTYSPIPSNSQSASFTKTRIPGRLPSIEPRNIHSIVLNKQFFPFILHFPLLKLFDEKVYICWLRRIIECLGEGKVLEFSASAKEELETAAVELVRRVGWVREDYCEGDGVCHG